jgi:hypothetical protein
MEWVERQVLNIPRDRIKSVSVVHPADGAEVEVARPAATDKAFTLAAIPQGRELSAPTAPEALVTGVQYLSIDDVRLAGDVGFSQPEAIAVFRTFDGLVITAQTVRKDEKSWVNITAAFEEVPPPPAPPAGPTPEAAPAPPPAPTKPAEEVRKEAADLNTKLAAWAFAIPDYKAKNLTASIESFLKPLTPPPAPPGPIGPPPQ